MNIADAEGRVMGYCNDFFNRLESVGCDNLQTVNSTKKVALLQQHLYPPIVQKPMQKLLDYQEAEKSDIVQYVENLCDKAKSFRRCACQTQLRRHRERDLKKETEGCN